MQLRRDADAGRRGDRLPFDGLRAKAADNPADRRGEEAARGLLSHASPGDPAARSEAGG